MAAFNFHRKIMEENPPNTTTICLTKCDPCIPICFPICPQLCNSTTTTQPPPPPPPTTVDIILKISPPKHHHSSLSLPLKISLVILVLTFSLFLLYTLYKFYTVWYRRRRPPPPSSQPSENQETLDEFVDHDVLDHPIWYIRTIGLNPSVISAITVVKYSKKDGLIEGTDCSVCLSDFQEDETLRLLPKCNHAFHVSCIDTWLRSHTNCPLCRAGIVRAGSDPNPGDSGRIEEARLAISSIPDGEEREREDEGSELDEDSHVNVNDDDNSNNKGGEVIGGGGGSSNFLIIRRSISLNDYGDCRIRSFDVHNNNNYYSDRHQFQIQVQPLEEGEEIHPQFHDS